MKELAPCLLTNVNKRATRYACCLIENIFWFDDDQVPVKHGSPRNERRKMWMCFMRLTEMDHGGSSEFGNGTNSTCPAQGD